MKLIDACSLADRCYWAFKDRGLKIVFGKLAAELMDIDDDFTYEEFRKVIRSHLVEVNNASHL